MASLETNRSETECKKSYAVDIVFLAWVWTGDIYPRLAMECSSGRLGSSYDRNSYWNDDRVGFIDIVETIRFCIEYMLPLEVQQVVDKDYRRVVHV